MTETTDKIENINDVEKNVKDQYEDLPYPQYSDIAIIPGAQVADLDMLRHHLWAGKQDYSDFTVLDAGCGTGDAITSLAHNLQNIPGKHRLIGIDLSEESLRLASDRIKYHHYENCVEFKNISILDVPKLVESGEFPKFDYIIANGVLHHMENPTAGFSALRQCLKPTGFMHVMIYAKYGRFGIDTTSRFLKELTYDISNKSDKIAVARCIVDGLPDTHLLKKTVDIKKSDVGSNDNAFYDILLHTCYHNYAVDEVLQIVGDAGLTFYKWNVHAFLYDIVDTFEQPFLDKIKTFSVERQWKMCELHRANISNHEFWVKAQDPLAPLTFNPNSIITARSNEEIKMQFESDLKHNELYYDMVDKNTADPSALNNIPIFPKEIGDILRNTMRDVDLPTPKRLMIKFKIHKIWVEVSNISKKFINLVDGKKPLRDIYIEGSKSLNIDIRQFKAEADEFVNIMCQYYGMFLKT